jgi:hypothetical protein
MQREVTGCACEAPDDHAPNPIAQRTGLPRINLEFTRRRVGLGSPDRRVRPRPTETSRSLPEELPE